MIPKISPFITLTIAAFSLHLIWENTQAPLFGGFASFGQHFPMCFWGTLGDVVFTLLVYAGIGLLKGNFNWATQLNKKDVFVLAVIGFFWAVGIEYRALLLGRWSYTNAMPIIPYLRVGLAPIIQMTILLPLSFYLVKLIYKIQKV